MEHLKMITTFNNFIMKKLYGNNKIENKCANSLVAFAEKNPLIHHWIIKGNIRGSQDYWEYSYNNCVNLFIESENENIGIVEKNICLMKARKKLVDIPLGGRKYF